MMKRLIGILFFLATAVTASAAPVISNVFITNLTSSTATIQWTTDVPATSQIKYGNDSSLPFANNTDLTLRTSHSMTLILLLPGQMYYFAVVSTASGGTAQSSTLNFSLCGPLAVPVTGEINTYYQYGSFTATWVPPAGAVGTPTACGVPIQQTVTGFLSSTGALTFQVADASKVTPGPGMWQIEAQDVGNIAPITINSQITQFSQEISAPLQTAAAAVGLTACLTNTTTGAFYPTGCRGAGGGGPSPPSFSVQLANSGSSSFASDPSITINTANHTLTAPYLSANANTVISVTAPPYNAKCDGITDDSDALNAALAAGAGGTVQVPSNRVCAFGKTSLFVSSNTLLAGGGGHSASSILQALNGMWGDRIATGVAVPAVTLTSYSIASNVITLTASAPFSSAWITGASLIVSNSGTFLDNAFFTATSVSGSTFVAPYTHANSSGAFTARGDFYVGNGTDAPAKGGYEYAHNLVGAVGQNIGFKAFRLNANGNNAGEPPMAPTPPNANYRGMGINPGTTINPYFDDVVVDNPSNDGVGAYCVSGFHSIHLESDDLNMINPTPLSNPTTNAITVQQGCRSIITAANQVLPVQMTDTVALNNVGDCLSLQAGNSSTGGSQQFSPIGSVNIDGLITKNCQGYGFGTEYNDQWFTGLTDSVTLSNWTSTGDGYGTTAGANYPAVIQGTQNLHGSHWNFRNEPRGVISLNSPQRATFDDITVDGWDMLAGNTDATEDAIVYNGGASDWPNGGVADTISFAHTKIRNNGRTAGQEAVLAVNAPIQHLHLISNDWQGAKVPNGTYGGMITFNSGAAGTAFDSVGDQICGGDDTGLFINSNNIRFSITGSEFCNNGQNSGVSGLRAGIWVSGTGITGNIPSALLDDNQGSHTQLQGIFASNSGASNLLNIGQITGEGNVNGLGLPNTMATGKGQIWSYSNSANVEQVIQGGTAQTTPLLDIHDSLGSNAFQVQTVDAIAYNLSVYNQLAFGSNFDSGTWNCPSPFCTGWTYSAGTFTGSNPSGYIVETPGGIQSGVLYKISFNITSFTGSYVQFAFGTTTGGGVVNYPVQFTTTGIQTFTMIAPPNVNGEIAIAAGATSVAINSFSIQTSISGDGRFGGRVFTPSLILNGGTPLTSQSSANSQIVTCPPGGTTGQFCGADGVWYTSVRSVSNSDGTLTFSPTTGVVVGSLALGNANTWAALQTFNAGLSGTAATLSGLGTFGSLKDTGAAAGTGTYCLQIDTSGNISNTGASCGSGGGGGSNVQVNGGTTLTTANFNGATPAAGAGFQNVTFQSSGSSVSAEVPLGSSSVFGLLKCGTGLSCSGGVASTTASISGMTATQLAVAGSATTITSSIAIGNAGSDIPQLSGGLLNASVIPNNAANTTGYAAGLAGGALGSIPYQSAANTTAFVAGATTSGHTFILAEQPSGSLIAPTLLDLATYLASPPAIGGTASNAGTFSSLTVNGSGPSTIQLGSGTYATLIATFPCNSGNKGRLADVSDSTTSTWGAVISGGGSNDVLAHCNGANWTVTGI